jgi:hypothetical protein
MLKLYTAFTKEIDDAEAAAEEILRQLNPGENMRANTIGMIFFHYDFAEDGILQEFAEALPFELVGCVSNYTGASGAYGDFAVSVTMFTSDDVRFSVRTIDSMRAKPRGELKEDFLKMCESVHEEEKPRLVMSFMPPFAHFSINDLLVTANKIDDPGVFFGTTAFNIDGVPGTNYVLGDGTLADDMCAVLAFYGEMTPKFHITSSYDLSECFGEEAVITDYNNASLIGVNDLSALEYLRKKGLISDTVLGAGAEIASIPAALTYTNNSKVACALLGIVPGTEEILTARSLEKGAKIVFSHLDDKKTLEGVKGVVNNLRRTDERSFIVFSSAARAWAFGANYFTELQEFANASEEHGLTYSIAYSGGEMCPVPKDGRSFSSVRDVSELMNMIHNFTLVVCSFN